MGLQTVLLYIAPALPAVGAAIEQWPKWRAGGRRAYVSIGVLSVALVVAWCLVWYNVHKTDEETQRAAVESQQHRSEYEVSLVHGRDLEARLMAEARRSQLIAEGCIPDPGLRRKARAVHPELQRNVQEDINVGEKPSVVIRRPPRP